MPSTRPEWRSGKATALYAPSPSPGPRRRCQARGQPGKRCLIPRDGSRTRWSTRLGEAPVGSDESPGQASSPGRRPSWPAGPADSSGATSARTSSAEARHSRRPRRGYATRSCKPCPGRRCRPAHRRHRVRDSRSSASSTAAASSGAGVGAGVNQLHRQLLAGHHAPARYRDPAGPRRLELWPGGGGATLAITTVCWYAARFARRRPASSAPISSSSVSEAGAGDRLSGDSAGHGTRAEDVGGLAPPKRRADRLPAQPVRAAHRRQQLRSPPPESPRLSEIAALSKADSGGRSPDLARVDLPTSHAKCSSSSTSSSGLGRSCSSRESRSRGSRSKPAVASSPGSGPPPGSGPCCAGCPSNASPPSG